MVVRPLLFEKVVKVVYEIAVASQDWRSQQFHRKNVDGDLVEYD
jgi:hypothetical protein